MSVSQTWIAEQLSKAKPLDAERLARISQALPPVEMPKSGQRLLK